MRTSLAIGCIAFLALASPATGAAVPADEASALVSAWTASVASAGARVFSDLAIMRVATVLLTVAMVFALMRAAFEIQRGGWALSVAVPVLATTVLRILIVQALTFTYLEWSGALYGATRAIGGLYQVAALSGQGIAPGVDLADPWAPAYALFYRITSIGVAADGTLFGGLSALLNLLIAIIVQLLLMLLVVFAAAASIWAFFGYSLLKLVGIFFVPALLSERFGKLFDSWLAVFLGFLVYDVLVRLVVVLALLGLTALLPTGPGASPVIVADAWSAIGYVLFAIVSFWGLLRVSAIAGSLTSSGFSLSDPMGRAISSVVGYFR